MGVPRKAMFALASLVGLACGQEPRAPRTVVIPPIIATAPKGIDDSFLGAPVDVHFHRLQGSAGRALFSPARIRRLPQTYVTHDALTINDRLTLEANVAAWRVNANLTHGSASRYGSYRAFQVVGISSVDDSVDPDEDPPAEAVFYVSKVYWGHSYEAVFEGNSRSFGAGLGIELAKYGGGINTFATTRQMKLHFVGSGLTPKMNDALFARTQEQVMSAYTISAAPVPIFVEYRLVPHRPAPPNEALALEMPIHVVVRFNTLRVQEDGSWGSTPWTIAARCTAGGSATPMVPLVPPNTRVDERPTGFSLNATVELEASPGDPIECTTEGTYGDTFSRGSIAPGRSQRIPATAGRYPMTISGSGRVAYVVEAEVEAFRMGR